MADNMAFTVCKMAANERLFYKFSKLLFRLTIFMILEQFNFCSAMDAYFPVTAVKLSLPINEKSQSIFSKIPIGQFQVLALKDKRVALNYDYSLEQNDLLTINETTGEVFMRNDYKKETTRKKLIITAIARNGHAELSSDIPHVSIDIFPISETDYCKNLKHVCFWQEAAYVVAEDLTSNADDVEMLIGALNTRGTRYLCGHIEPKYTLDNGNEFFKLQNNFLYTKKRLDHEILNFTNINMLTATVTCSFKSPSDVELKYRKILNITLMDLNDNGPELQSNKTYNFHLDQPHYKMNELIGNKILFVDKDSMSANGQQTYKVVNDTLDMVTTQCNAFESDHTGRRNTIISCQIIFARNGILSDSPYCFDLIVDDKVVEMNREVIKTAGAHVCLHTNVEKIHRADRPMALALRSRQQRKFKGVISSEEYLPQSDSNMGRLTTPNSVNYPKDVYVYRQAGAFHRVTQPSDFSELLENQRTRFALSEHSGAFSITPVAGIVFVKDTGFLQTATFDEYTLNITWHDQSQHNHIIQVHLLAGRPDNTSCELKVKSRSQTCAQIKFQRQCEKFCGTGTNGGSCTWRGSNSGIFGRNYASCVPNPQYCPDHICDPLEELNTFICPQDCTPSNKIMGPHSVNENRRGILSASGTCTCEDNGKCSCAPIDDDEPKAKRKRKNEGKSVPDPPNVFNRNEFEKTENFANFNSSTAEERTLNIGGLVCDKSCIIISTTCPVVFILLIICLLLSRRNLKQRKRGKETLDKHKSKTQTNSGADFEECDIQNGDLPLMQLETGFKFEHSDVKWEFDRSKLVLDAILGEGEFGKVMKGYATNIAGMQGVTTVAVKMLKNGANSVEFMSLLSEFQLLQEVSHPNVIKLLGACTKDGPPMIIIEYARYGSLRSYLRLSRKIECAGVDFTDGVEPVTVKQILSFAWQICKGMAYLTEIKLVHRDLAARNVLLADGKICKVSDFGLTRDVYEDDAYLKRSRDRVPVKWMAPESLADHVYTTKSDVWAFGVLCWELITLGASPYPGVPPQNLYHLLKSGYRMERPENCSEEIYTIVRSCWTDDANARPSFKYLASQFEKLLGNNVKYIEIESNAVSNPIYCSEFEKSNDESQSQGQSDLTKLSNDFGEPDNLDHLWRPPSMSYDTLDATNSREFSSNFSAEFLPPPGYDLPRPLIETATTEQVLRYENDLRFPLNVRKSIGTDNSNVVPHYAVPVKRGRSYVDMTKKNLIPDNLDSSDFEKHLSKTISFRFSSLLNLQEIDGEA